MGERSEAKSANRSFASKMKIWDILTRSFASRFKLRYIQPFLGKSIYFIINLLRREFSRELLINRDTRHFRPNSVEFFFQFSDFFSFWDSVDDHDVFDPVSFPRRLILSFWQFNARIWLTLAIKSGRSSSLEMSSTNPSGSLKSGSRISVSSPPARCQPPSSTIFWKKLRNKL